MKLGHVTRNDIYKEKLMNKVYKTYFLSLLMAVLASVMFVSCSVDDDTQGSKLIVSDFTTNNVTMKNGYWIVYGSDAGRCSVTISGGANTLSNDVYDALSVTFSNVPWHVICNTLLADNVLQGVTLVSENDANQTGSLALSLFVVGYTKNYASLYYDIEPASDSFKVAIDGEEHMITAQITGSVVVTITPNHTITSNLMIAKITDNGVDKALKSPLKLVCVAQL